MRSSEFSETKVCSMFCSLAAGEKDMRIFIIEGKKPNGFR